MPDVSFLIPSWRLQMLCFILPTSQKSQTIPFIIMYDKEKRQILMFKKQETNKCFACFLMFIWLSN